MWPRRLPLRLADLIAAHPASSPAIWMCAHRQNARVLRVAQCLRKSWSIGRAHVGLPHLLPMDLQAKLSRHCPRDSRSARLSSPGSAVAVVIAQELSPVLGCALSCQSGVQVAGRMNCSVASPAWFSGPTFPPAALVFPHHPGVLFLFLFLSEFPPLLH